MDAAAKATGTYLRRPPQPDPARHPTECTLLLLRLPASGRHYRGCRAQPGRQPLLDRSRGATENSATNSHLLLRRMRAAAFRALLLRCSRTSCSNCTGCWASPPVPYWP
ncbi:hypothetical protein EKL94_09275 [Stenotrophomonas maltophilia]|uniref:Uncharacterized protein n=1 Tax=Stenotrophomonas maltophilia TaxID=40324 RepID=A0A3S0IY35_STEMA|nr:hypothetical protein EKL94_09275 [Stenotrophomonas maltophilia]